ncbi:STAS domain-containing protein [Streptomyces sp. NBC_01013]|uniref:STAS domain-containing protein n=1 Tax=Streptomyces sp. NBC_01013 TaxID=2903718 RepID=UPI00386A0547|nr:STAS domain-containing protein [Streptomyces sp. NBC_01013]
MTAMPRPSFKLAAEAGPEAVRLRLAGDLDYDTADELLQYAHRCMAEQSRLRALHLDCSQLRACDSMGVSTLIQIHRSSTARDVRLHLENPPPFLERLLRVTGIRHLFAPDGREPRQASRTHADEAPAPAEAQAQTSPPPAPTV